MKEKSKLEEKVESILIDAGEVCPDDYQLGFNWEKYNEAVEKVLEIIRDLEK